MALDSWMRRDDRDLAERRQRGGERANSFGVHAIVIGDQNSRHWNRRS